MKFILVAVSLAGFCLSSVLSADDIPCQNSIDLVKLGDQVSLKTPNYPQLYPTNADQNSCVNSPTGTRLNVSCSAVEMGECKKSRKGPTGHYMYVSLASTRMISDLEWICGSFGDTFETMTSDANSIQVGFHADATGAAKSGYNCVVTVVGQDGQLPSQESECVPTPSPNSNDLCAGNQVNMTKVGETYRVTTPNYPNPIPKNVDGRKCFSSPDNTKLQVTCTRFGMTPFCYDGESKDYMYLSTSGDKTLKNVSIQCGQSGTAFQPKTSDANQLIVGYHSDEGGHEGYDCNVTVVADKKVCSTGAIVLRNIGDSYRLTTPDYPTPPTQPLDTHSCIRSPPNTKLLLTCSHMGLSATCPPGKNGKMAMGDAYMYMNTKGDDSFDAFVDSYYCGKTFTPIKSDANGMMVGFHADNIYTPVTGADCSVTVVAS